MLGTDYKKEILPVKIYKYLNTSILSHGLKNFFGQITEYLTMPQIVPVENQAWSKIYGNLYINKTDANQGLKLGAKNQQFTGSLWQKQKV